MGRLLSVSATEAGVLAGVKTETRRLGWWEDRNGRRLVHPGDELVLVRKVMGRAPGEPLVRLAEVTVSEVRREPLSALTYEGLVAEGVAEQVWDPRGRAEWDGPVETWLDWYCAEFGVTPDQEVTVIAWERPYYLVPIVTALDQVDPDPRRFWHVHCATASGTAHVRRFGPDGFLVVADAVDYDGWEVYSTSTGEARSFPNELEALQWAGALTEP